jgi:DNA-binding transcriptional regulator GbsR (MarR family)
VRWAQIHALLYVSAQPLTADEIAQALEVARSNVSTSLRELQTWGVVKVAHVLGDRRDHFQAESDVWEMFRIILEGRKRREVDPAIEHLRECVAEAHAAGEADAYAEARMRDLLGFFETVTNWYQQVHRLPRGTLLKLIKLGGRVGRLLDSTK